MDRLRTLTARVCLLALTLALLASVARAEVIETFEGPEPTWKHLGADGPFRVDLRERAVGEAHRGQGCEHFRVTAGAGTYAYLGQEIPRARIIEEFTPSLWVRSDRAGLRLLARVVFPRSLDRAGKPHSLLLRGQTYERQGSWQQLTIVDTAKQLQAQLRVLRAQLAADVDAREAYVDLIALNAYGGPGATNLWIDDLEIAGYVPEQSPLGGNVAPAQYAAPGNGGVSAATRPADFNGPVTANAPSGTRLVGSILMAEGRPLFPRVVEHRGESFEALRALGFNAVRLAAQPTDTQLDEANQTGIWLIAPPPPLVANQPIGPRYGRVLAWDLGRGLEPSQAEAVRQQADLVRLADRTTGRPLLAQPEGGLPTFSRCADLLLAVREPLLSSQELPEYTEWLRTRPRLARPGTPWWMPVQNEPAEALSRQVMGLAPSGTSLPTLELDQMRLVALTAVACGTRGLYFPSRSQLGGDDPAARQRQALVELVNLELANIEAWGAAGNYVSEVAAATDVRVSVLAMERSQLWIVLRNAPGAALTVEGTAGQPLSFVVPGVTDAATAYEIQAGGLKQLRHKRVAGGVRVTIDDFSQATLIAFTDDPLVVGSLTRRLASNQARAAQLRHELAALDVFQTEEVDRRLAQQGRAFPQAAAALTEARAWLARSKTLLDAGELAGAQQFALAAQRAAGRVQRGHWDEATRGTVCPVASPLCMNFATLPAHFELGQRLSGATAGANLLVGGACDDLPYMVQAGWRHYRSELDPVNTAVELSPDDPHQGRFALRLRAEARDPRLPPAALEAPPVWVVSAPVAMQAGQIARISGWIKLPRPLAATSDGLMIFDSAGGLALAQRVRQAGRWQPFVLYRAVESNQPLTVSFALGGLGEAWIDDLSIVPLGGATP